MDADPIVKRIQDRAAGRAAGIRDIVRSLKALVDNTEDPGERFLYNLCIERLSEEMSVHAETYRVLTETMKSPAPRL